MLILIYGHNKLTLTVKLFWNWTINWKFKYRHHSNFTYEMTAVLIVMLSIFSDEKLSVPRYSFTHTHTNMSLIVWITNYDTFIHNDSFYIPHD